MHSVCGYSSPINHSQELSRREEYLNIISKSNFLEILERISIEKMEDKPVLFGHTFVVNNRQYDMEGCNVVTIGRAYGNSIVIEEASRVITTSRVNVLIFAVENRLAVVDPGCLTGIRTLARSGKFFNGESIPCEDSLPEKRKNLYFQKDETFILGLGSPRNFDYTKIVVGPKMCCICFDKPRVFIGKCGHFTMCSDCANIITECPICRVDLYGEIDAAHINTYTCR